MTEDRNHDLVHVYRQYFEKNVNPINLGLFIDSYIRRTDLGIVRELDPIRRKDARTLKMPVLNITGALSPHVDDTVTFNGRLDPVNSTWMKVCNAFPDQSRKLVVSRGEIFIVVVCILIDPRLWNGDGGAAS